MASKFARWVVLVNMWNDELTDIQDHGVDSAIQSIYRDMEYATSLIKRKAGKNGQPEPDEDDDGAEESWTFVGGDEPDPDMMTKKLSEGLERFALKEKASKSDAVASGA